MGVDFVAIVQALEAFLGLFEVFIAVAGAVLIFASLWQYKAVFSVSKHTGQPMPLNYIHWQLVAGVLLISFTRTDAILAETLMFNTSINPFSFGGASSSMSQAQAIGKMLDLLYKTFGAWAVFRGIMGLRDIGAQGQGNDKGSSLGKSIGFMVFGEMAIHHLEVFEWFGDFFPIITKLSSAVGGNLGNLN